MKQLIKIEESKLARQKLNVELYKKVYLIRRAEEKIREYYAEDEMKTPMHMSMGEEAIAAGVCHALNNCDQVFTTYRSHAVFLAKTQNCDEFFAEMYAKETSSIKGKGGSMHLCLPADGFMGTSAIVGAHIPVAVGCAFANKIKNNNKIVAVFFGDGAVDEGVFWESINVACLMRLSVLFLCEDNNLAVHTFSYERRGYSSITQIISRFNCQVFESDSTDTEEIYNLTLKALMQIRRENKPCFMNLKYYRYLEHVGVNYDFDVGYRSKEEFENWYKRDPVSLLRKKLLDCGLGIEEIKKIEEDINSKIDQSILKAKKAPFSEQSELHKDIFK
ncbi:MAG: thiamine pyrophosphate-dependent dehydrogenase E1 component subunit alpha [Candidatus Omnitrophica bacterium]|nr:thiamine pyrophosphate-dependent dehydrogenase E1 component subunit alpha [Candidatus Omnitrophota bacterium]